MKARRRGSNAVRVSRQSGGRRPGVTAPGELPKEIPVSAVVRAGAEPDLHMRPVLVPLTYDRVEIWSAGKIQFLHKPAGEWAPSRPVQVHARASPVRLQLATNF
ncbi:unnamed protein product [Cercospora beticola]|nr:unnamed protein product [Cercospora beticola]